MAAEVDHDKLKVCRGCEQLVIPEERQAGYGVNPSCPFCGDAKALVALAFAMECGLVEP